MPTTSLTKTTTKIERTIMIDAADHNTTTTYTPLLGDKNTLDDSDMEGRGLLLEQGADRIVGKQNQQQKDDGDHDDTSSSGNDDDVEDDFGILTSLRSNSQRRETALRMNQGILAAAYLIRDAVMGDDVENPAQGAYDPYLNNNNNNNKNNDGNGGNGNSNSGGTLLSERYRATIAVICRRICSYRPFLRILNTCAYILLVITFIEPPNWCRDGNINHVNVITGGGGGSSTTTTSAEDVDNNYQDYCEDVLNLQGIPATLNDAVVGTSTNSTSAAIVEYYPNTHSMLITSQQSAILEWICLLVLVFYTILRIGRDGSSLTRYLRSGPSQFNRIWHCIWLIILVGSLLLRTDQQDYHAYSDDIIEIDEENNNNNINNNNADYDNDNENNSTEYNIFHFIAKGIHRIKPIARLGVLMTLTNTKSDREIAVLIRMIPQVFGILTLLLILMFCWAWFGNIMFWQSVEGITYFENIFESIWTLYICVTTANYPDVMMSSYNENRWVALYFISFMIMSYFFLMNIALAVVVNEYENATDLDNEIHKARANDQLLEAWYKLDYNNKGIIDKQTIMSLFIILNTDFPEFQPKSDDEMKLLFTVLDKDGSSTIEQDEFLDFGMIFLLDFVNTSDYRTLVEIYFPTTIAISYQYQQFENLIKSDYFEQFVDFIVFMNAIVVAIQSYPELSGTTSQKDTIGGMNPDYWDGSIDTIWESVELIFTVIYVLEMISKIIVYGWKRYTEHIKNVFDMAVTTLAAISIIVVYCPNSFTDGRVVRMIALARILRLLRLFTSMERFQEIGRMSIEVIIPATSSVLVVLFYLLYIYACIGMMFFGGLITRNPNDQTSYRILQTDFSDNEYWANNFNDMFSSMNVLFNLLVTSSWTTCADGFEAAVMGNELDIVNTRNKWYVRLFFVSFHIFAVVFVNNLVIAKIINEFLQQMQIKEKEQTERQQQEQQKQQAGGSTEGRENKEDNTNMLSGGDSGDKYIAKIRHAGGGDGKTKNESLRKLLTSSTGAGSVAGGLGK